MAELRNFNELVRNFSKEADFLTIYIEEAHPNDEWRFDNNYDIYQHVTLEDRVFRHLSEAGVESPIVLDNVKNAASVAYGGLPERLYIILDGIIVYEGGPGPFGYHINEVEDWLTKYKGGESSDRA
ncbi:hypothetical protein SNE40_012188 [Patella caerulea]|uniref:Iodothyronine deiodinase n=1 Tax=Patella caerulea TaxID=87958 RepID=A0AAN8JR10_PATCE